MANNALPVPPGQLASGSTYYAILVNSAGLYYRNDGASPEAFNSAHWSLYVAAAAAAGTGGTWAFVFPSNCPAGNWTVQPYLQSGGSPAFGDSIALGAQDAAWNGSYIVDLTDIPTTIIASGTLQSGSASVVVLASGSPSEDGWGTGNLITLTLSGVSETRSIVEYNGSTKAASLNIPLHAITPSSSTTYVISTVRSST